ncbi:alkaline phosphatase D family protein [Sphingomonas sp.]|jgi:alkaline phosphatase D|uniref:alkaline phosphatase D family protein n=1 Tax=Sphingomonas sp. TaxID=28214 RepID=UPI002D7EA08C|nr:alkaline phosphatase D family protein [Sphingomonas sp.]HEU0044362.1 alkaline phosphatase D family protein [Sphingomonas sp.]
MTIDRRSLLGMLGAGAALPVQATSVPAPPAIEFLHGVASGDPTVRGAILWTRVTPPSGYEAPIEVRWQVMEGDRPVASGRTQARASRDWTVKVEPRTLRPGQEYRYWFEAVGIRSPEGRVRTLPVGSIRDVVLAVASCALHPGGLFNAYRSIADLPRVDAVVHLGDYIYEYGESGFGASIGKKLGRIPEPRHEIVTLADYRKRHAQYKRDPDLQACHARAAMIAVWDDHETTNDGWTDGAQNHQPGTEGDWATRKAAAMQAYFEWMPIRDPVPGKPWEAINRAFRFGDLATLAMVETRLLARSEQVVAGAPRVPSAYAAALARRDDPARELLGEGQRRWLEGELARSVRAGEPWQVLGNQVVMARVAGVAVDSAKVIPSYRAQAVAAQASYAAGLPFNLDAWDGYPAARERLYATFRRAGSRPLVLSGDSHAHWANRLADAAGMPVAAEFGATAITSPSIGDAMPELAVGALLADANDEVLFCDQRSKGYVLLTLTRERARAEFRAVSTVLERPFTEATVATYEVRAGDARLEMRRV